MAPIVLVAVEVTAANVVRSTTCRPIDSIWAPILEIASGLVGRARAEERYAHIVSGIRRLIPCDSVVLLRLQGDVLVPVASEGLVPESATQRFVIDEHPRLAQFMRTRATGADLRITTCRTRSTA